MLLDLPTIEVKLHQIIDSHNSFNRDKFTLEIKHKFASLFEETTFEIYANRIGEDPNGYFSYGQEYLYDLTVFEEKPSTRDDIRFVTKTILVLESEWATNFKCIIDDFQKLLVANAINKVLIFKCHSTELDGYIGFMNQNIKEYQNGTGNYFLSTYLSDMHKFVTTKAN
jgi:hypothetical protein